MKLSKAFLKKFQNFHQIFRKKATKLPKNVYIYKNLEMYCSNNTLFKHMFHYLKNKLGPTGPL
jgi:hypothetical protein